VVHLLTVQNLRLDPFIVAADQSFDASVQFLIRRGIISRVVGNDERIVHDFVKEREGPGRQEALVGHKDLFVDESRADALLE